MKITIDDGIDLSLVIIPKYVSGAINIARALPDGKLLSMRGMAARLKVVEIKSASHPSLNEFVFKPNPNRVYFGNSKTVKAAREQNK